MGGAVNDGCESVPRRRFFLVTALFVQRSLSYRGECGGFIPSLAGARPCLPSVISAPLKKARTSAADSSATSSCGTWPVLAYTTSFEPAIAAWNAYAASTGIVRSSSPHKIRVGVLMFGMSSLIRLSRILPRVIVASRVPSIRMKRSEEHTSELQSLAYLV